MGMSFAAISIDWAAGRHLGLGTLHETLQESAVTRQQGFILLVWLTEGRKCSSQFLRRPSFDRVEGCSPGGSC